MSKKRQIFTIILSFFQVLGFAIPIVLEYLSDKKMGVFRYLIYKQRIYEATLFTHFLRNVYEITIGIGALACLVAMVYVLKSKPFKAIKRGIFSALLVSGITLFFMWGGNSYQLRAYYFFLIGFFLVLILQYIKIGFAFFEPKPSRERGEK